MKTALYIYKNMFTLNQSNKESYMILITRGNYTETKRMVLIK